MGAQPALLRTPSRPRIPWAPLLPLALAVFLLSGLAYYHIQVRGTGIATVGLFQGLVALAYDLLGFVPAFMLCLLVLIWSSIWFISGQLQRPWGRLVRVLIFGLSLALVVNLTPEGTATSDHGGLIGSYLATRLVSVFGYGASTLLAAAVALVSVLLATDFFFFRYFDSLSREAHGLPPQPQTMPLESGVENEAVAELRTLEFAEAEPSGRITIQEDPLDFAYQEADPATTTATAEVTAEEAEKAEEAEEADVAVAWPPEGSVHDMEDHEAPAEEELDEEEPGEEEEQDEADEEDDEEDEEEADEEADEEDEGEGDEYADDEDDADYMDDGDEDEDEDEDDDKADDSESTAGRQGRLFEAVASDADLLGEALALVMAGRRASASLLQRRLRVSFGEAVELLDALREQGIVGGETGEATGQVLWAGEATGEATGEAAAEA